MLQRGVPIEIVSAILGHSNIAITKQVYAHLDVDHLREAVRKLG
jgi:site-specific recombinase XerD